jgi:hypothetical protein
LASEYHTQKKARAFALAFGKGLYQALFGEFFPSVEHLFGAVAGSHGEEHCNTAAYWGRAANWAAANRAAAGIVARLWLSETKSYGSYDKGSYNNQFFHDMYI